MIRLLLSWSRRAVVEVFRFVVDCAAAQHAFLGNIWEISENPPPRFGPSHMFLPPDTPATRHQAEQHARMLGITR